MNHLDKKRVAKNFSSAAKDYEGHAVLQKLVTERLLSRLVLIKLDPKWVVDAGSGIGFSARALRKKYRAARVLQVDLSREMLACSRHKTRQWFSKQYYACADAERLPVSSGAIDLVFSSMMLQWCNDPERVFAETKRVLRPAGLYLFATLGPETLRELRESWAGVDDGEHVHPFVDMHIFGDALVRTGMEGVVMETEKITLTYPDSVRLMHDLKTLGANNALFSRRKSLTGRGRMQRMTEAYEKFRANGLLPATYEIIYGHAWAPLHAHMKPAAPTVFVPVDALTRQHRK